MNLSELVPINVP